MNAEQHAIHDLQTLSHFRAELHKGSLIHTPQFDMTAGDERVAAARERREYAIQQSKHRGSLAFREPLYRSRLELARNDDRFRVFFSPVGFEFLPIDSGDGDDLLVSWAHPQYLHLRDLEIGETARAGKHEWRISCRTEVDREHGGALYNLLVNGVDMPQCLFAEVRFDHGKPVVRVADASDENVDEVLDIDAGTLAMDANARVDIPAQDFAPDPIPLELGRVEFDVAPREVEFREKPRLVLDTIVARHDGKVVEIPFALDNHQWEAMRRHATAGTMVLMGPPGTGKTTVALLRATTLVHSTFQYDADGKRASNTPEVDLRKSRFRVIVVTEHLRHYLKEFLSSPELGLAEAEVVNLRGAFLETFVRHKTLTAWINGLRFRLSKKRNNISDVLVYIKALPHTLRLCFYHAVLNAQENIGEGDGHVVNRIFERVLDTVDRMALNQMIAKDAKLKDRLRNEEGAADFDLDVFLDRHGKTDDFFNYVEPRTKLVQRAMPALRTFISNWLARVTERADQSLETDRQVWLYPGADDLLLARFVEDVTPLEDLDGVNVRTTFNREAWHELVRLVDPQEVLLRVIMDYEKGEMSFLEQAGLDRADAMAALNEWKEALAGGTESELDDEDADEVVDDVEADLDNPELQRRRGAFTRSDFPLLAALARVFLALPPEAKEAPEKYHHLGFLFPGDLARYDHVIVDEGQDFTYAEIHLALSLVENRRMAATVSGDRFQRMDWRFGVSSIETIETPADRQFSIRRNYRQTVELATWVGSLSNALFGKAGQEIEPAHHHGPQPSVSVIPKLTNMVKSAADTFGEWYDDDQNPFTAQLLIGFDAKAKTRITNSLSRSLEDRSIYVEKVEDGRLIERGRVSVADVPTVKGLEFDGVVVFLSESACDLLSLSSPQAEVAKNMLYVACSRAKRNLKVILQKDVDILRGNGLYGGADRT